MKNYALIVKGIEDLLVESYEKKDKATVSKMLLELKNNTKLKFLYTLVENLRNGKVAQNNVDTYINENIKFAKTLDFTEFDSLVNKDVLDESTELLESIGTLLFEDKTIFNMSKYHNAFDIVKQHLVESNTWEATYRGKLAEYSKSYVTMDSSDKQLFEQFLRTPKTDRAGMFKKMVTECVEVLNTSIQKMDDSEIKLKLYETKDMISKYEYDDSYVEKIVKIHELKKSLL